MQNEIENKRSVTICAGLSGTGKSTFALRYTINDDFAVRFFFDPDGEFCDRLNLDPAHDGFSLGVQLCRGWVVFDPHPMFPGRIEEAFRFFCEWAFEISGRVPGRKVLVVDEVWKYCTPSSIPPELSTVNQTGRKRGLGLLVNTQLPNKINGSILNEVSEMVCFRLQAKAALDKVAEYGFSPDQVKQLPDLCFIARNLDSGGELNGRIKI